MGVACSVHHAGTVMTGFWWFGVSHTAYAAGWDKFQRQVMEVFKTL